MSTQPYEPRPNGRPVGARKGMAGAVFLILLSFLFLVFEGLTPVSNRLRKKVVIRAIKSQGLGLAVFFCHLSPMHCLVIELRSNHPKTDILWTLS